MKTKTFEIEYSETLTQTSQDGINTIQLLNSLGELITITIDCSPDKQLIKNLKGE